MAFDVSKEEKMLNPKYEIRNPKQYSNFQNFNDQNKCRFYLEIRISDLFRISCLVLRISFFYCLFIHNVFALNLDKIKEYFISGDYKAAISEGEKILADTGNTSSALDELYYFLGLSYMKTSNYLRAADIFEIIGSEFKKSPLRGETTLALGDTFFLRGDYDKAEKKYQDLLANNQAIRLRPAVYYRLSRCAAKLSKPQAEQGYLVKLKQEFPLNLESRVENEKCAITAIDSNSEYTVQVGYFSNNTNAGNLFSELTKKGYPAYIEKNDISGKQVYRVKVGQSVARREAEALETKLSKDGYSTKICP